MAPRPILKRSPSQNTQQQHGVHFPPSPSLTCTFSAYSAAAYDRSPIVVTPNSLALPERGCPGRTYLLDESSQPRGVSFARDYHPRALAFATKTRQADMLMPPLIPDLSSESEESDGFATTPADSTSTHTNFGIHGLAAPQHPYAYTPCDDDALAFLPYSPSASPPSSPYMYEDTDDGPVQKPIRRRPSRERKYETSRDPDRIRNGVSDIQVSISTLSISTATPVASSRSPTRRKRMPTTMTFSTTDALLDDGCLGGF